MNPRLSKKIMRPDFQGEFTASILAAAASPDLISFAGGLPNPVSFPVEACLLYTSPSPRDTR